MPLACLLVNDCPVTTDLHGISTVALVGCQEFDPAVAVPVVVPVHKCRHPQACLLHDGEWSTWVIGPVFCCAEQRFGIRVVVAADGVVDKRLPAPLADPLSEAGPTDEISCNS